MMVKIEPLGDCAVIIQFGDQLNEKVQNQVKAFSTLLAKTEFEGFIEFIPAYTTVTIFYHPSYFEKGISSSPFQNIKRKIEELLKIKSKQETENERTIQIPVCYGEKYGPDLLSVANYHSLTIEDVITLHTKEIYRVAMIGFAPGFPYLTGLNERIATPRLKTPRKLVAEGSVGIAGIQTGIYSISSPGGWQIIGQTPTKLFNPSKSEPSLLRQGDKVQFVSISEFEYQSLLGKES